MTRLFRSLKPYTMFIVFVFILVFFQSLSELYLPTLMANIVDKGIVNGDTNYILKIGGLMLLVAGGGTICAIVANFLSSKTSMGFGKILRNKIFEKVESFSLQEFDKLGTASLITRTTNDITQVQQVVNIMLKMMLTAPMMCIGGIIMAVSRDAKLSLILVVAIPILVFVIYIISRKGMPLFKKMQVKIDKLNLVLREELVGARVIRAFNRNEYEKRRFEKANTDLTDTAIRVNKIMATLMPLMMLVLNLTTVAIIWFGGIRIDNGSMQVGDMMAFIQYAMQIMFSLVMLSMMFVFIPRASASATRINEVLDLVPQIKDVDASKNICDKSDSIEFRDVTFSYEGAEKPALNKISFTAKAGEVTAIIGSTGSGKSTLVNLIPHFYDIDSGKILIGGRDIREMPLKDLRAKIGFVPQKVILFSGTVADNIRYGKEDATFEEVKKAAKTAEAMEFISGFKEGFKTPIAQGGRNISGGQKQRLSIARALVRRPKIYIFDDSFSALDFKTDAKLRQSLKEETKAAIQIIVAQRISTVLDADQIIVLDEGKIAGIGKHKELLATCEVYREIVSSQLREEEIA